VTGLARRALLLMLLAPPGLRAQPAPTTDEAREAREVRAVIRAQLDALAADDAQQAFSFASDEIRRRFGTAQAFTAMVRDSYPAVYRPASVAFLKLERRGDRVQQAVQLTDGRGRPWLALYEMQRLDGGTWRIAGCVLSANDGQSTQGPATSAPAAA
jgi:hypothetical protein